METVKVWAREPGEVVVTAHGDRATSSYDPVAAAQLLGDRHQGAVREAARMRVAYLEGLIRKHEEAIADLRRTAAAARELLR